MWIRQRKASFAKIPGVRETSDERFWTDWNGILIPSLQGLVGHAGQPFRAVYSCAFLRQTT